MNFLISNAQLRGDVNSDGFVNAKDAQAERRYIIENYAQGINIDLTDVSGDGEVNVADIVSIYNIINGTEPFYKPYRTYFQDLIDGNGVAKSISRIRHVFGLKEINFVDQDEKVYRRHEKSINLIGNTAIENITNDDSDLPVNVYNTQGQLLRQNIPASEATQGLPAGIYIVGNKKVIVK